MENQDLLIKSIRKLLPVATSINDEVATILEISYDAAHRRISGKSKFSIEETVRLANHYRLSLDELFQGGEKIIVEKTVEITSLKEMLRYFKTSAQRIAALTKPAGSELYYSAKDIPLFYFLDGTILSKFKAYVWLNLSDPQYRIPFDKFVVDEAFMEDMHALKAIYETVSVKEIWNDTTINSSLQQILYFYESGLITHKAAEALFKDLKRIINGVKDKCSNPKFSIYYNELILLNNNVMISSPNKLTMFVPYTLLGYFITDNAESCGNVHRFFLQQIKNSTPINQTGIKEQSLFFNKALRKIDYYIEKLDTQLDIMY